MYTTTIRLSLAAKGFLVYTEISRKGRGLEDERPTAAEESKIKWLFYRNFNILQKSSQNIFSGIHKAHSQATKIKKSLQWKDHF
jgi:hypothetical protein